jgi:hypothetical protein
MAITFSLPNFIAMKKSTTLKIFLLYLIDDVVNYRLKHQGTYQTREEAIASFRNCDLGCNYVIMEAWTT